MSITPTWASAGGAETQATTLYGNVGTGVTISSNGYFTGPNELQLNNNAGISSTDTLGGVLADAGARLGLRFRCSALPTTNDQFLQFFTSGRAGTFSINLFSTGVLHIRNGPNTVDLAVGSTVLAVDTVYEIVVAYTLTSTTVFTIKLFVNGLLECTATNSGTLPRIGTDRVNFSMASQAGGGPATNSNYWFGDQWTDKDSSLTYPGPIRATAKRPFSNGTTNGFTTQIGAGGSGYGSGHAPQVNERPLSQTNGWSMVGAGSAVTEEYGIEGESAGDFDTTGATYLGFLAWVFAKSALSETGQIVALGNNSNIALTSTAKAFVNGIATSSYPGGGTDVGIITSTTVTTVSLYECGVIVLFTPAVAGTGNGALFYLRRRNGEYQ